MDLAPKYVHYAKVMDGGPFGKFAETLIFQEITFQRFFNIDVISQNESCDFSCLLELII